nr:hypothetical protein [Nocardioides luti]
MVLEARDRTGPAARGTAVQRRGAVAQVERQRPGRRRQVVAAEHQHVRAVAARRRGAAGRREVLLDDVVARAGVDRRRVGPGGLDRVVARPAVDDVVPRPAHDEVGAGAAAHGVVAGLGAQRVRQDLVPPGAGRDHVGAGSADHVVAPRPGGDPVVVRRADHPEARRADHGVVPLAGDGAPVTRGVQDDPAGRPGVADGVGQDVLVAGVVPDVEEVVPGTTLEGVAVEVPAAGQARDPVALAVQPVVARATADPVGTRPGTDDVVAPAPVDHVAAAEPDDHVAAAGAGEKVGVGRADERRDQPVAPDRRGRGVGREHPEGAEDGRGEDERDEQAVHGETLRGRGTSPTRSVTTSGAPTPRGRRRLHDRPPVQPTAGDPGVSSPAHDTRSSSGRR